MLHAAAELKTSFGLFQCRSPWPADPSSSAAAGRRVQSGAPRGCANCFSISTMLIMVAQQVRAERIQLGPRITATATDLVNRGIAWMRRGQRVDPGIGPVRVNLGSALSVTPGWIHVDSSPNLLLAGKNAWIQSIAHRYTGSNVLFDLGEYRRRLNSYRFVHHDLAYGVPFADETVDFLYSSHLLEHLPPSAGLNMLRDCYRVLRPGGVIRLCVPDLEKAVQFYLRGDRMRFLSYFFTAQAPRRSRHQFMYDFELLRDALASAHFVQIEHCKLTTGRTPDLELLDDRSDETLHVEAVRPA